MRHSAQSYYNLLVVSALDGTFPGYDSKNDRCMYRVIEDGRCTHRCAVGVIIPDDRYKADLESKGVGSLPYALLEDITPVGLCLADLSAIQKRHDSNSGPDGYFEARTFIGAINLLPCFANVLRCKGPEDGTKKCPF